MIRHLLFATPKQLASRALPRATYLPAQLWPVIPSGAHLPLNSLRHLHTIPKMSAQEATKPQTEAVPSAPDSGAATPDAVGADGAAPSKKGGESSDETREGGRLTV